MRREHPGVMDHGSSASILRWICVLAAVVLLWPPEALAFKPKTHLYLALQSIAHINECRIEIEGARYDVDPGICDAIKTHPADYLGGVVGPDGFPDLLFGQGVVHPDTRCTYAASDNGDCQDGSASTWTLDWTRHLWDAARARSGDARKRAIAFTVGFMTHGAGDMWAHTFVNRFAGGVWPELSDVANLDIALRHVVVEGVVGEHTPDIKPAIAAAGGLNAPTDFIYDALINDSWARARSKGSFIGLFYQLRDELVGKRGDAPSTADYAGAALGAPPAVASVLRYHYLNCWVEEIDSGLREWPNVSLRIADAMFVKEATDQVWDPFLKDFKDDYMIWMLGNPGAPDLLLGRCAGRHAGQPLQTVITVLQALGNPGRVILDAVGDIEFLNPLQIIFDTFKDFMFKALTGLTYDQFMDRLKRPSNFLQPPLFTSPSAASVNTSLTTLMSLNGAGMFSDTAFRPAANTILLGRLALVNPEGLDALLAGYNVGSLYGSAASTSPDMKPNVMLGFIRSFDGNHQWRDHAPPLPITEPERRFGQGMLLYKDCLARRNFFKRVFRDWAHDGADTVFYDESLEDCAPLSNLPPVSMTVEAIGQGVSNLGGGSFWAPGCGSVALRIRLTNHQTTAQNFAILVTDDLGLPMMAALAKGTPLAGGGLKLCNSTGPKPGRLFHRVVSGQLPPIPSTGPNGPSHTMEYLVVLPCLGGTSRSYRVYLLEKLMSTKLPLFSSNPRIKPNEPEYLTLAVQPVDIQLIVAVPGKPSACVTPPTTECQAAATWTVARNSQWKYESIGVCEACGDVECDADRDSRPNEADNCPLTANADQADADHDQVGDACDPLSLRVVVKDWLDGILLDPRFVDVLRKYPFLFDVPKIGGGRDPLPGWSNRFPVTTDVFKRLSRDYLARKLPEDRYLASLRTMLTGATYMAEGTRVTAADVQVSAAAQSIRLSLSGRNGGRIRLEVPRLVIDANGQALSVSFAVRAAGALPGQLTESVTREVRTFDVRGNPGTTELLLERRP